MAISVRLPESIAHFFAKQHQESSLFNGTPPIDQLDLTKESHRQQFEDLVFRSLATAYPDSFLMTSSQKSAHTDIARNAFLHIDQAVSRFTNVNSVMITDPRDSSHMLGALLVGSDNNVSNIGLIVDPSLSDTQREAVASKLLLTATQTAMIHGSKRIETDAYTTRSKNQLSQDGWDIQTEVNPDGSLIFHASKEVNPSYPKRKATRFFTTDNGEKRTQLLSTSHIPQKRSHVLSGVFEDNSSGTPQGAAESKYDSMETILSQNLLYGRRRRRIAHATTDIMTGLIVPHEQGVQIVFKGKPQTEEEIQHNLQQLLLAAEQTNSPHALYIVRAHNIGRRVDMSEGRRVEHYGDLLVHLDAQKLKTLLENPKFIHIYKQTVAQLNEASIRNTSGGINIKALYALGLVKAIDGHILAQDPQIDAPLLEEAQRFVTGGWHKQTLRELGLTKN